MLLTNYRLQLHVSIYALQNKTSPIKKRGTKLLYGYSKIWYLQWCFVKTTYLIGILWMLHFFLNCEFIRVKLNCKCFFFHLDSQHDYRPIIAQSLPMVVLGIQQQSNSLQYSLQLFSNHDFYIKQFLNKTLIYKTYHKISLSIKSKSAYFILSLTVKCALCSLIFNNRC